MLFFFWILFVILILAILAIDLMFNRSQALSFGKSLTWTLIWIAASLVFNFAIFLIYDDNLRNGKEAALLFFTGYLVEKSLSLENVIVIALIFSYFKVPLPLQRRVLISGVLGVIFFRFMMILGGSVLLSNFSWMSYAFGSLLIITAFKMLIFNAEKVNPEKNPFVIFLKIFFPVTKDYKGHAFFIREKGLLLATPLLLTLAAVMTSDLIFALDSIPAIFAITTDPFIVFTSNVFAILGLRSLYFVLAPLIHHFYYMRISLVVLLTYVGIKMMLIHHYPINSILSFFIILGILSVGIVASFVSKNGIRPVADINIMTARDIKRIFILFLGITILLAGLAMLVLPGPGLIVIPIGLILLAKEFIWARKLLKKLKSSNETVAKILGGKDKENE